METKVEALSTIIRKMTQKEILLPDFQRKFVWREEERQSLLVASVLAKMPVGSILLLSSDARDYAYKMIGCAERKTNIELGIEGEILALLDGQGHSAQVPEGRGGYIYTGQCHGAYDCVGLGG